ncbi:tripartite motif-containing protein 59-like [Penaeus japonicus]|uniref:tripartite motif-containing protein 59-like n=1 Tax=Penaeus japonicus TaxID=27405 RepID=UPI001C70FFD7|nr:tripartite motif-containing protein 59-like [Penaeus japonicus]
MDCKVCYNNFDDGDYRPRNLECGHSFCTSCLKGIHYGSVLECPECRHAHEVEDVTSLPVGFGVLRAVEAARGEVSAPRKQDEWNVAEFIIPRQKEDLREDGKECPEKEEEEDAVDLEVLKKSHRNVLWSKIYLCAENLEELQNYERVLAKVSANCLRHMKCLEKIMQSRQSVVEFMQEETERCKRKQESVDRRKKELFHCKEQLDGASSLENIVDVRAWGDVDRRKRLNKFLRRGRVWLATRRGPFTALSAPVD